jgi:putative transposase
VPFTQTSARYLASGDLTHLRQKIDYGEPLNQRLHAWPFAKIADWIEYKAQLRGIRIIKISQAYSSQTCHACGKIARSNRKTRGS